MAGSTTSEQVQVGNLDFYTTRTTTTPSMTGYFPIANGTALTLPELLGFDTAAGTVNFGSGGMEAIRANIALNGGLFKPVMQTVGLNIGFAIGKKVFSKQRSLLNKGAKMAGFSSMVKF